jgi:TonB family protein
MTKLVLGILTATALWAQGLIGALGRPTAEQAGAYPIGNGVSAPRPIRRVDPSYSTEGRACQIQGSVVLKIVIGTDGAASEFRIQRALGFGLDEQAIAAVRQWTFQPGILQGKPVPVQANVELNFHLLEGRARLTDTCTEFLRGVSLLEGKGRAKDEVAGVRLIETTAAMDLVEAQLRLASLYEYGDSGVTLDSKHSENLYRACAKAGLMRCQAGLGRVLISDSLHRMEGLAWLELASDNGSTEAKELFTQELKFTPADQQAQARALKKILLPK